MDTERVTKQLDRRAESQGRLSQSSLSVDYQDPLVANWIHLKAKVDYLEKKVHHLKAVAKNQDTKICGLEREVSEFRELKRKLKSRDRQWARVIYKHAYPENLREVYRTLVNNRFFVSALLKTVRYRAKQLVRKVLPLKLKALVQKSVFYVGANKSMKKPKFVRVNSRLTKPLPEQVNHFGMVVIEGWIDGHAKLNGRFSVEERGHMVSVDPEVWRSKNGNYQFKVEYRLQQGPSTSVRVVASQAGGLDPVVVGPELWIWNTSYLGSRSIETFEVEINNDAGRLEASANRELVCKFIGQTGGALFDSKNGGVDVTQMPVALELSGKNEESPISIPVFMRENSEFLNKVETVNLSEEESKKTAEFHGPFVVDGKNANPNWHLRYFAFDKETKLEFNCPIVGFSPRIPFDIKSASRVTIIRKIPSPTDWIYFFKPLEQHLSGIPLRVIDTEEWGEGRAVDFIENELVIVIRYATDEIIESLVKQKHKLQSLVFLFDDDVFAALDSNQLGGGYRNRLIKYALSHFYVLLNLSDWLVVSSEQLVEKYKSAKTLLLRPALPSSPKSPRPPGKAPIKLAFIGTEGHRQDLAFLVPALRRILREYRDVEIDIVGFRKKPSGLQKEKRVSVVGPMPWAEFDQFINEYVCDIFLVPLLPFQFNLGKSYIKVLDCARYGAAGIFSRRPEYSKVVVSGVNGLLVDDDPDCWYRAIKRMIDCSSERTQMAEANARVAQSLSDPERFFKFWRGGDCR